MAGQSRPPDRIRVRRNPKKGRYERATVEAILDRGLIAHVAFLDRGPGRFGEVRQPNAKELNATTILAMTIQGSAKVRYGGPDDDSQDARLDIWAGEIPILSSLGEPIASPGLRPGIPDPRKHQGASGFQPWVDCQQRVDEPLATEAATETPINLIAPAGTCHESSTRRARMDGSRGLDLQTRKLRPVTGLFPQSSLAAADLAFRKEKRVQMAASPTPSIPCPGTVSGETTQVADLQVFQAL